MSITFQKTSLWLRTLGSDKFADNLEDLERLRASFLNFRTKVKILLERISSAFPNLTVHDITHIDALWETADIITGAHYPINPMEAFVLGGAMLLHDSALCFEAYEQGVQGVRETVQWRDAYAAENDREERQSENDIKSAADFTAVRLLHANQAATLVDRAWKDPDTSESIYLIDDYDLRKRYGQVIGKIASSHHWDIEDVASRPPDHLNAPGDWPADWRIDPIKLACILRCADAAHIDNRRAPDFLYALTRRSGLSLQHWKAQNWLARVDIDQADSSKETLVFTSTREFGPSDSEAWWVAYDAIQLVETEIMSSNSLLKSRPQNNTSPEFSIRRIAGVSSPEIMGNYLRTKDWQPWSAKLHVGNVERLVKSLGGEILYGQGRDQFSVAVRELIQNSRDAVAARRELETSFAGKIRIRIIEKDDVSVLLQILDDGVGMSQRVVTGSLLDFGSSFWKSDLMKEEFPGLRSSKFRSIGRFGIGFYSIFMIANDVEVASRRWDQGLNTICTMHFPKGLTLRPIFLVGKRPDFNGYTSTIISCRLHSDLLKKVAIRIVHSGQLGVPDLEVPLHDYLARLVCGLDVTVELQINDGDCTVIHKPVAELIETEDGRIQLLSDIALTKYRGKTSQAEIVDAAKRLRPLKSDNVLVGVAAIDISNARSLIGVNTIGGLISNVESFYGHGGFVGYLDSEASSAKREIGKLSASPEVLKAWAKEQIEFLKKRGLSPIEQAHATDSMARLHLDPTPVFQALFFRENNQIFLSLEQIVEWMLSKPIVLIKSKHLEYIDTYARETSFENYLTFKPIDNSPFLSLEMENDIPKYQFSFIGCLANHAQKFGRKLSFETRKDAVPGLIGNSDVIVLRLA